MSMTREQIESEARQLPREERARLAETLLSSLEEEADVEAAWAEEIQRRLKELDEGRVATIPASEVFEELEDLVR